MLTTSLQPPLLSRVTSAALAMIQRFLMISGLALIVGLVGLHYGHAAIVEGLKAVLPPAAPAAEVVAAEVEAEPVPEISLATVSPRMRGAQEYVARRYRVSIDALRPIFAAAEATGRELNLDPLLIVAVIGVESGFNPLSQSVVGAQGLMQVVPRFHQDKRPADADELFFLDPQSNIQVGSRVLKEFIRRTGDLEDGLQQFAGAGNDPDRRYSSRVLAERQRLEQATQRPPVTRAVPPAAAVVVAVG